MGEHLLIKSRSTLRQLCIRGRQALGVVVCAVGRADAILLSQSRCKFESGSSRGFAVAAMANGVERSEETRTDKALIALNLSSCGRAKLTGWVGMSGKSCVWAR
jgi:hypothetical protein